nr:reverse transcriptase domain-containing protein [Tanacetum cinerariifolium]
MRTRSQSRNNFAQQEASPAIVEPLRIELPFLEDQFQKDPPVDPPEVPMADNRTMAEFLQARPRVTRMQSLFLKLLRTTLSSSTCLKIIESKSKVRQSRAKAVIAKVSTSSSTPAISSNVAELKDMVKALLLDKKNQSPAPTPSSTPAPVKAVKPNCVTCGGAHSYQNCPATNENAYRDNIQEGNNFNQNRGGNFNQSYFNPSSFNQGQLYRPQVNQPPAYQAPVYQAPIPQTQRVSQIDFESYVKANDAILRNMQSHGQSTQNQCQNIQNEYQNLQIQMATLTDMMSKIVSSNTASSSGSGTLPGNTITNPKEELKGITTRSYVAYQGPKTPSPSKQGTEVTKDQVQTPSSQNTAPVQPSVIQSESQALVSEPVVSPVSAPMPNLKPSIPYPSRRDNEKCRVQGMDDCLALADICASINLMPFSVWEALSLPKLTSTCMTLELADRSVSKPIELKVCEAKTIKSSVDEPPEVELKDQPHHLEYAFLEGDNKFPVIIAKELGDEE